MKIKVCGMKHPANIARIARLKPDMMGFIFYERSPRFVGGLDPAALDILGAETDRVGVFVNADETEILHAAEKYALGFVQLHGDETPTMCRRLSAENLRVIKALGVAEAADMQKAADFEGVCDFLLFDTKSKLHGGSGLKFDHSVLRAYEGQTSFFLSGGIGADDAAFPFPPQCAGVDINSRFETAPGVKDPQAVGRFINTIRNR